MTDFLSALSGELQALAVIIAVGILVFVIWGASKAAAKRAGSRFGWGAIGVVLLVLGAFLWIVTAELPLAGFLAFLGFMILVLAIAFGGSRR